MLKAPSGPAEAAGYQRPALSGSTELAEVPRKWPFLSLLYAPETFWQIALGELKQQMTKATFNAWLVDSRVILEASTSTFLVISVRNQYAQEWLTYRLQPVIVRTLSSIAGYEVEVCFIPRTLKTMRRSYDEPTRRPSTRLPLPTRR